MNCNDRQMVPATPPAPHALHLDGTPNDLRDDSKITISYAALHAQEGKHDDVGKSRELQYRYQRHKGSALTVNWFGDLQQAGTSILR